MKRLCLILCCALLIQCEKAINANYQNVFSDCMEKEDIVAIEEGVSVFNSTLQDLYNLKKIDVDTYKRYLHELRVMSLPREFFTYQSTLNYLEELKKKSSFTNIYITLKEQMKQLGMEKIEVPIAKNTDTITINADDMPDFFYVMNAKGSFLKCMSEKSSSQDLKTLIEDIQTTVDIAPRNKIEALSKMIDKVDSEIDQKILIAMVVFDVYFGTVFSYN